MSNFKKNFIIGRNIELRPLSAFNDFNEYSYNLVFSLFIFKIIKKRNGVNCKIFCSVLLKNLGLKDNIFLVIVDVYLLRSARICSQEILQRRTMSRSVGLWKRIISGSPSSVSSSAFSNVISRTSGIQHLLAQSNISVKCNKLPLYVSRPSIEVSSGWYTTFAMPPVSESSPLTKSLERV